MTFTLADRVRETSTTTGVVGYVLAGAVSGFRTFLSTIGNGNSCSYVATMGSQWEVGRGTVTSSGPTLFRDTILASSNAGAAVNWTAGTKDLRCDADASYLLGVAPVLYGPTATTSGTVFDFTSVPANAIKLEIFLDSVSLNGSSDIWMQLGDSGGLETSGYDGQIMRFFGDGFTVAIDVWNYSINFMLNFDASSSQFIDGNLILDRISSAAHIWRLSGHLLSGPNKFNLIGTKTLSGALTQFRITSDTPDAFDAGAISVRIWT